MFADPSSPLTFCIIGKDPFGSIIDDLMHDNTIRGRAVALRRAVELGDHDGCHIVFVSALEDTDVEEVSRALTGTDILIVGDRNLFAHEGGMINLVRKDKGVGMEINHSAVSRTRLRMSSKLLALADIVE